VTLDAVRAGDTLQVRTPALGRRLRSQAGRLVRSVRCDVPLVSRYGFNLLPTLRFRQSRPTLAEPARRVLDDLRTDGVTLADAREMLGDDAGLVDRIDARVRALQADRSGDVEQRRKALAAGEPGGTAGKTYLVEMLGQRPQVSPEDPLVQFALHEQVMGVAEEYFGCKVRLHDVNVWQNLAHDAPASKSQRWHRDLLEDMNIVKAFLYVDDVPDGAGPLSYVRGTNTREGRRMRFPTTWDGIGHRVQDEFVEARFGERDVVRAAGRAGQVAWADTLGLHRGGHARTTDRLVVMYTFCSAACCRSRCLEPAEGVSARELPQVSFR
jgi:hypothetical protein